MRILLLLVLMLVCACARVEERPTPPQTPLPDCHEAWVYAPGNYILELAANSTVTLNPKHWDFPLFCTAAEAAHALEQEITSQKLPKGDWALYRLDGDFQLLAGTQDGKVVLQTKAKLVDWQAWPKIR